MQRAASTAATGSPSATNAIERPRTPISARAAAPAAFRILSSSALAAVPSPITATRLARTSLPSLCKRVTWPAVPRISPALTSRVISPPRAASSVAAAPSSVTGLVTATASRSAGTASADAAEVEIFMSPR